MVADCSTCRNLGVQRSRISSAKSSNGALCIRLDSTRSDNGNRTHNIYTSRITSGEELKRR